MRRDLAASAQTAILYEANKKADAPQYRPAAFFPFIDHRERKPITDAEAFRNEMAASGITVIQREKVA